MRLVVGISGATGAIFGIRLLEALQATGRVETLLVMSKWGRRTIEHETNMTVDAVRRLADETYAPTNLAAAISSGSFRTDGMVIAPCSTKTLAAIPSGYSDTLIARAADVVMVVMKEGRRLVLLVRESPLSAIHLQNMLTLARLGVARVMDHFGLDFPGARRWDGRLRTLAPVAADRDDEDQI